MMTTALVDEFEQRLRDDRDALLRTLATTDEEIAGLETRESGALPDAGDRAVVVTILSGLEGRQKRELDEIEDALRRLRAGSFGLCQRCGERILLARLRALPAVRCCLGCQAARESSLISPTEGLPTALRPTPPFVRNGWRGEEHD
jgi:DnaK suppressor protein